MYRVSVIGTKSQPLQELWLDAVTVRESSSGTLWEFCNEAGFTIKRVLKARVNSFQQTPDRRRPVWRVQPPKEAWNRRFDDVRRTRPA